MEEYDILDLLSEAAGAEEETGGDNFRFADEV